MDALVSVLSALSYPIDELVAVYDSPVSTSPYRKPTVDRLRQVRDRAAGGS
jgi:hypothetical protein